jgi:hypothetical protein
LERRQLGRGGGGGGDRRGGLQWPEEAGQWESAAEKHRHGEVLLRGRSARGGSGGGGCWRVRGAVILQLCFVPLLTKEQGVFAVCAFHFIFRGMHFYNLLGYIINSYFYSLQIVTLYGLIHKPNHDS